MTHITVYDKQFYPHHSRRRYSNKHKFEHFRINSSLLLTKYYSNLFVPIGLLSAVVGGICTVRKGIFFLCSVRFSLNMPWVNKSIHIAHVNKTNLFTNKVAWTV